MCVCVCVSVHTCKCPQAKILHCRSFRSFTSSGSSQRATNGFIKFITYWYNCKAQRRPKTFLILSFETNVNVFIGCPKPSTLITHTGWMGTSALVSWNVTVITFGGKKNGMRVDFGDFCHHSKAWNSPGRVWQPLLALSLTVKHSQF